MMRGSNDAANAGFVRGTYYTHFDTPGRTAIIDG